jgi:hypothetical protein
MKSINTEYNNNYFRSRLEAKWAVFFDLAGIKYIYEPEGFYDEKTGRSYLPDFFLPEVRLRSGNEIGLYIEIKPLGFNENDFNHHWFTKPLCLFIGEPIYCTWDATDYNDNGFEIFPNWDNCMMFHACPNCKTVKIEFSESNYDECNVCNTKGNDYKRLDISAKKATFTRFEHNHNL